MIDLVLDVTSCIRSVKPLELNSLLGPNASIEFTEPALLRPISPPLVAPRTGSGSFDLSRGASTSITMLVARLMEVPFGQNRRDAYALAYASQQAPPEDSDIEDFQQWENSSSLDCPNAEVMSASLVGEPGRTRHLSSAESGSIDGLWLVGPLSKAADLHSVDEGGILWFGAGETKQSIVAHRLELIVFALNFACRRSAFPTMA